MLGEEIVAEARRWLGTPFHHQGRLIDVGADCAGLIIGVARGLGLSGYDIDGYARQPDGGTLREECDREMTRVAPGGVKPGDVLLMRLGRDPQHLAIVTAAREGQPTAMIHVHSEPPSVCVEHSLDARWRRRVIQIYRLPGVV